MRIVYPMQDRAMQFLNLVANKMFSVTFPWLLEQSVKDSLSSTEVLSKQHYEVMVRCRKYGNLGNRQAAPREHPT